MNYDAIIIGGGLSGLVSAVRLSHFGWKVRIFERHVLPGGLNSYYYRGGQVRDVGLHAMTNYAVPGDKQAPLNRLFRQLRLRTSDLELCEQRYSLIKVPGHTCRFTNDHTVLQQEIAREFPGDYDGFLQFEQELTSRDVYGSEVNPCLSVRQYLEKFISDPALRDILLMPVMLYGNPASDDMSCRQYEIMYRGIFSEGLARPRGGILPLLSLLQSRLSDNGGEISLGTGVRQIICEGDKAVGIIDDSGEKHSAPVILSSAGARETVLLCGKTPEQTEIPEGNISFTETIFRLKCHPREFGLEASVIFESKASPFVFRPPEDNVDFQSQLVCAPGNYLGCEQIDGANFVRLSHLANPGWWFQASESSYREAKEKLAARQREILEAEWPGMADSVLGWEIFTPRTIKRYTGKINGAIYGSPTKISDGSTGIENLKLIGTDQGLLGIVGSMISGMVIANGCLM